MKNKTCTSNKDIEEEKEKNTFVSSKKRKKL